ncbi:hypothetical protein RB623_11040 [Mesorhizobium sp. LHD-90]|uniref:hypothetical protein n=1 Tax=Mesorhizobium sp. LHD-90 TaxID=3071414 RepID=UPI0027E200C0|nr:hypothetical protein [Mesorhizobium sp. LHD-90]MDQ6434582.1 hypothetical protein [Mesorhizobium sp. LHD-90]
MTGTNKPSILCFAAANQTSASKESDMPSMWNDTGSTRIQAKSYLCAAACLATWAAAEAPPLANAAVEQDGTIAAAESLDWRTADAESKGAVAGSIEIVAPTDERTLGLIIYRQGTDGGTPSLRFGGPR